MRDNLFYKGDIVKVSNPNLKTHAKVGVVLCTDGQSVEIQIKGLPKLTYYGGNLELVRRETDAPQEVCEKFKEDNDMVVKGNYDVAVVNFIQGVNTEKGYVFALFDADIAVGDTVLVDTCNGYCLAVVQDIFCKKDADSLGYQLPTKEVICKVDFTAFNDRKEKRAKAAQLKRDMEKKVKELQEIAVFELLAEKNPELAEMLSEYKNLAE